MKKKVTHEMIVDAETRIRDIPRSELPRIFNELNGRNWPNELGEVKERPSNTEICLILDEIKWRVGFKAVWRHTKMVKEGYTEQEFEDWWESEFIYNPLNKLYEFFGDCEGSYKSRNGYDYIKYLPSFLFGILFAVLLFLFV